MALVYKIDLSTLKLKQIVPVDECIEIYGVLRLTHYDSLHETDLNILKHCNQNYDTFYNSHGYVESDIHYHDDEELRLIIAGSATFYVPYENDLYIAICNELDQVTLWPKVTHWFHSNGELLVYRFFKQQNSRVAYETENLDQRVIEAKQYIDDNGYNFSL